MYSSSFYPAEQPNDFNVTDVVLSSNTLTITWEESVSGVDYRVVLDPELSPDCVAVNTSDTSYSCSGWEPGSITTVNITANYPDATSGCKRSDATQCTLNLTGKCT